MLIHASGIDPRRTGWSKTPGLGVLGQTNRLRPGSGGYSNPICPFRQDKGSTSIKRKHSRRSCRRIGIVELGKPCQEAGTSVPGAPWSASKRSPERTAELPLCLPPIEIHLKLIRVRPSQDSIPEGRTFQALKYRARFRAFCGTHFRRGLKRESGSRHPRLPDWKGGRL
jgi:hypothetical protein